VWSEMSAVGYHCAGAPLLSSVSSGSSAVQWQEHIYQGRKECSGRRREVLSCSFLDG